MISIQIPGKEKANLNIQVNRKVECKQTKSASSQAHNSKKLFNIKNHTMGIEKIHKPGRALQFKFIVSFFSG